jgi:hypothetical protein
MNKKLDWVKLTPKQKRDLKKAIKAPIPVGTPTFFNLESDKNDPPSRFAKMSKRQVIESAEESARNLAEWAHHSIR